jgi:predicted NBD/HSP70 family sugar kinase
MASSSPPAAAVRTATPRTLRAINDAAALELLLRHGALSRAQLAEMTGLSKPTATQLLARLSEEGLVVERGETSGAPGPNARLYVINDRAAHVAALDVAEDHATVAVADITGRVLAQQSADVDFHIDVDPVPVVRRLVSDTARRAGVRGSQLDHVVLGVSAAYDAEADALTFAAHIPGWARRGVLGRLRAALRTDVVVENDVNLAAVWERTHGVARQAASFALLWVGEGLGLSIELGGALYSGARGGAGEIGYMPLGMPTADGGRGAPPTFEDVAGAPAVVALGAQHGFEGSAAEVVAAARADLSRGMPLLAELARRLAAGLAPVVAVLDPPLVVLAGSTNVAGGEELLQLISGALRSVSPFAPPLALTASRGSPVLQGALDAGLERVRETVFGFARAHA